MGEISVRWSNSIEKKKSKEQMQAILDNTELSLATDEISLDLTELVMNQANEIEQLKNELQKLKDGGNV